MALRRVLFVGPMWEGSSCVPRARGLERLGLDVTIFDSSRVFGTSRLGVQLGGRLFATPSVLRTNASLALLARRTRPDVVWVDKGDWIHPTTLRHLRTSARFLVHFNTDDVFGPENYFWLLRRGLKHFDLHLTTNRFNVREIPARSAAPAFRVGMGYDQDHHVTVSGGDGGDAPDSIVFIGHREAHTERYLVALREAGLPVRVWGDGWHRAQDPVLKQASRIPQSRYSPTIAGAALVLCVLSRQNRNESTGRSFEIPAIGGCLLAEHTDEHAFLYRDGEEAILFRNQTELVEKARRYMKAEAERRAMAAKGHLKCTSLNLSWAGHLAREWPLLERRLETGSFPRSGADDFPLWAGFRGGAPAPVSA